jgi:hypothetical protein
MMSKNNDFKDLLLFEVQKAFYDERGKGARYRLTTIGVSYFEGMIKNGISDLEAVRKCLLDNNIADGLEYSEETFSVNVKVKNCCLKAVREYFVSAGMQPLGCPIANVIMKTLEVNTGLSPELLPIKIEGDYCNITLAKMASSDVVEG